ncbi:nucleotidyl transferase AbiEii/AbiGii toxin family protein [Butyrivibrio sp. MC2013]|uniref:nucleotidyl transferase AbiEii/AbiGii toxin family protein n=1 Tax=Butyrivibrio sp. MC2013 TaxID=1280686 RepID=UPI0003F8C63A|nr:nucleotidyl transferase AbiEii/AbiGii toxin family protein [Butyrivibrio sp. MC2013]
MISAISVKDRLKNQAFSSGKTFQEALTAYGLERTVYRLSMSEYKERFTLKGGIFLYALFDGEFARATRDIDLLVENIPNNVEDMREIFENIFSFECDDALRFDLDTLDVKDITEFKEYHGVNISIMAYLDRTKIPVSIDIGFGDVIYPERVKMDFPVMLDMEVPQIYAYSISSVISEKFEAIVSLGDANSRYKDFYDIYILASRYDINGIELKEAVRETFEHRGTGFDDIFAFSDDFLESEIHQSRWKAFLKKKKALVNVELEEVVGVLKTMLLPIVDSIARDTEYLTNWDHTSRSWK